MTRLLPLLLATRRSLNPRNAITLSAIWIATACDHKPRENESHPSSSSPVAVDSVEVANRVSIDSADATLAALVPLPPQTAEQVAYADSNTIGLQCIPNRFSRNDTIRLLMEYPHGEYLMVRQPDGTGFFLTYPDSTKPRYSVLVPADSFVQMPEIRFRADVRSRPFVYGRDTLEPVFTKPGKYVLTIGHKMETGQSSEVYSCTIRLVSR
ncbi:MAG TPA: hypothetical protein VK544_04590 [Gemmatimonadaceae bacterium]|nr:hypothetical protein [Gemmatimonadaceae bacterium]